MLNKEQTALEVWAVALERLRTTVNEVLYKQWITALLPVRLDDDNCLILGVADDFFGGFVSDSYGRQITEALCDVDGTDYVYKFESGHQAQVQECRQE